MPTNTLFIETVTGLTLESLQKHILFTFRTPVSPAPINPPLLSSYLPLYFAPINSPTVMVHICISCILFSFIKDDQQIFLQEMNEQLPSCQTAFYNAKFTIALT